MTDLTKLRAELRAALATIWGAAWRISRDELTAILDALDDADRRLSRSGREARYDLENELIRERDEAWEALDRAERERSTAANHVGSLGLRLAIVERERDEARGEVEALKDMVEDAYNSGFGQGMREETSPRGGIPWMDSVFKKRIGR